MKRRTVLRNFVFISAGVALFPYCKQENGKVTVALKKISISGDQEKLLDMLTQTIIPTTDTPGAKETGASLFALTMIDDCFNKEEQEKFTRGMQSFDEWSKKTISSSFADATADKRIELLGRLEKKDKNIPEVAAAFYQVVRKLTLQAYTSSEYYMSNVVKYEMVPGRWHGCVPVKQPA